MQKSQFAFLSSTLFLSIQIGTQSVNQRFDPYMALTVRWPNSSLEWTGRLLRDAVPPQAPCLPIMGGVIAMPITSRRRGPYTMAQNMPLGCCHDLAINQGELRSRLLQVALDHGIVL
jgi:hypothetical protein